MAAGLGIVALVIMVLLTISALFSAAETALTSVSRGRMHQLERDGTRPPGGSTSSPKIRKR
jgi:Mg2+/Co2+ transporter CorB